MVVVAQARPSGPEGHRGGVGIGDAGAVIGRAAVGAARLAPVGPAGFPDPVVAHTGALGQCGAVGLRQRHRERHRGRGCIFRLRRLQVLRRSGLGCPVGGGEELR